MAGGFMSGFGSAFAKSFNQASADREQREQDMFRLQYADYISRRDIQEKQKLADAKLVKQAKMLAEDAGTPEAWTDIHNRLQSGWEIKDVQDYLEEWEPEITSISEQATTVDRGEAEPDAALSSKAETSVSAQMTESGMPVPEGGGIFGDLKKMFDPMARAERDQSRTIGRVAQASGVTEEDVLAVLRPKEVETSPEQLPGKEGMQIKWKKKDPYKWIYDAKDQDAAELNLLKAVESGDQKAITLAKKAVSLFQKPVDWWTKERDQAMVNLDRARAMGDPQGIAISEQILRTLEQYRAQEDERALGIKLADEDRAQNRTLQAESRAETRQLASEDRAETRQLQSEDRQQLRTFGAEERAEDRQIAQENRAEARQIREEKRNEKPFDYLSENDPIKARNNLIRAELAGNPEHVDLAKKVYENTVIEKELATIREMKTQGKYFESTLGLASGPDGNKTVVKRNGVWTDMVTEEPIDDQSSVRPWTEEQEKKMTDVVSKIQEPARAYGQKATAFVQSVRDTQDMIDLREQFPDAMTGAGWLSLQGNIWARNLQSVWNTATADAQSDVFNDSTITNLDRYEQDLESNLKSLVHGGVVDKVRADGLAYALMQTKAIRAAYSQAKATGAGTGQGLGQREYERILNTFMNPDSKAFIQDRQDYILNQHAALKQEAASFNQFDPQVQWFKTQMDLKDLPVAPVQDIDQYIAQDDRASAVFNNFRDQSDLLNPETSNSNQVQTKTPIPENLREKLTPEEKTLWNFSDDRTRELLKKKYGGTNAVNP